jgi:hypothetical protein
MRQVLGSLIGVAILSACTHVPITSIPKLANIDPETTDLSQVELAVRVPQDFRLHRDGASIEVVLTPEGESPETLKLTLEHSEAPLTPFLIRQQGQRFKILRFELDPADAKRATDYRARVIETKERLKAEGRGGSASFSLGSTGCLAQGANPFQDLRMKFFMRTKPDEEFYPPIKEIRISPEDLREEGDTGISFCDEEDMPRLIDTA